ncbi:GntR family transcriptional regulator [Rhodococcus hoagii]|nr:GntR family transcriptional regulator [Prescottella equi]
MNLSIDPSLPVPIHAQLRDQVVAGVHDGALPAGALLPTVRGLAARLDVSPTTVARSYGELRELGIITTSGRQGTRIAEVGTHPRMRAQRSAVAYAETAHLLGIPAKEALSYVRAALNAR